MTSILQLLFKIHIHPLLWALMLLSVVTAQFKTMLMLLIIVLIHELGHSVCAMYFSWRIKSIVLLPFGGAAEVDEHGNRPLKEEMLVIAAGPAQHIWMAGAAYLLHLLGVLGTSDYQLFMFYNLSVLLFNLIPVWPLDGGKFLFLLFSLHKPFQHAHKGMLLVSWGILAVYCAVLAFADPLQLNLWAITLFLFYQLTMEHRQRRFVLMRFLMERYYGRQQDIAKLKPITADQNDSIFHVLLQFQRGFKHQIIVERNGEKWSQLDENELLHAYFNEHRTGSTVGELVYAY
ncbi:M50 family metallopeptidase [Metabacillus sp. GX 13764]|uniref:M50 family metallopeptidase n=1 Tax=Metabacillus kandeliae TaxID=2900151 RepID=UPI001E3EBB16|nr:M50 family metallopeptidase [Metabacillus kandeliae]MCD7032929.1 M50 family metallopeptidase [Metabacillus kandeliae]